VKVWNKLLAYPELILICSDLLALTRAMIQVLNMMKRRMTHETRANQSLERSMDL